MESKKGTLKALEKMKKETLDKLETLSDSAMDRFMDEMAVAIYEHFGTLMEAVPFMASAARIAANFCSITFALALQSADLPLDIEMGLSEVELDVFTTLARVIPSLCPLGTTTTLPKLDQLQGDLVGAEEVLAAESRETDRKQCHPPPMRAPPGFPGYHHHSVGVGRPLLPFLMKPVPLLPRCKWPPRGQQQPIPSAAT